MFKLDKHWTRDSITNKLDSDATRTLGCGFLSKISEEPALTDDDKKAQNIILESMEFKEGRYQIQMPWKKDPETLSDNYYGAFKRLFSTENHLRDSNVSQSYSCIVHYYIKKDNVTKLEQKLVDKVLEIITSL